MHPDELIMFFGTLFNSYNTTLKPNFPKSNNLEDDDDVEEMLLNDTLKNAKMILKYYNMILSLSQKNVLKNQKFVGTGMV